MIVLCQQNLISIQNYEGDEFYDNTRRHIAALTKKKFLDFRWNLLDQPLYPYSPDTVPSD